MHLSHSPRLLLIALLLFSLPALSQQTGIRLRLVGSKGEPVGFATVRLTDAGDSTRSVQALSDSAGRLELAGEAGRQYLVRVTAVGYRPLEKGILVKAGNTQFTLSMEPADRQLGAVVVTSSRPLMRQEDDKTIVDPEALAATSTNAFEIMEKTPGLFVDQDGNIYLNSTTPALVYINGREQKMSAADIATLLKNLPPNAIASIEVMRTPSARYDASGSGGIVNVVLRKGVRIGLTGSLTVGGNQGRFGNQFVGLNLNNNNGALTTYLNLQVGRRNTYDDLQTSRAFTADSLLNQDAYTRFASRNAYIGYGLSYQLNRKWEIGYDGRLSLNRQNNRSENLSQAFRKGETVSSFTNLTNVQNDISNFSLNQGVNLKYKIDSLGSEWTTDLSFTYSPNNTNQLFSIGDGELENNLRFFSAQTNYLRKLKNQVTVETGLKSSLVWFRNSTDYFRNTSSGRLKDHVRTGAYDYQENINAAYVQASKKFGTILVKVGTRVENTRMNGQQLLPQDTSFSINRTDLFPYIYLSRNLMKIAGYDLRAYLVYRRTISRPAYEYLNPSQRFIDPFLFETGNPSLRPQFTHNYEANISVDERPILAIGMNDTRDIFNQVLYTTDTSRRVTFRTYDNLGRNRETYFRALGAIPPGKRYFFVAGAQYNHNFYEGIIEGNKPLSFRRGSWSVFTYQTFRITPLTQFALNGFVRFKGQQQFYELGTFGMLNLSITQQLLQKKLSVTLSANDVFFTNNNTFQLTQGSINATGYRESDTRRIGLNIRYTFGIRKREEKDLFSAESPEKGN
jgi:iron complex outermembrane receptor protein